MVAVSLMVCIFVGGVLGAFGTILAPLFALWMCMLTIWHGVRLPMGQLERWSILVSAMCAAAIFAFFFSISMWTDGFWLNSADPLRPIVIIAGAVLGAVGFGLRTLDFTTRPVTTKKAASPRWRFVKRFCLGMAGVVFFAGCAWLPETRALVLRDLALPSTAWILATDLEQSRPISVVSKAASQGLVRIGTPAVEPLIPLLKHKRGNVRKVAAWTLAKIGPNARSALPVLLQSAQDDDFVLETGDIYSPQADALRALPELGPLPPEILPQLVKLLDSNDSQIREAAAETIGHFETAGTPAIPELTRLLEDEWEQVRDAAAKSLARIDPDFRRSAGDR